MTDEKKPTWEELYQAAEAAAERAHEAIDDIAGWSGSAGHWPLQESSTRIQAVLAAFRAPPFPTETKEPMNDFKPGSIVVLKSGGPKMTILRNKSDGGFFECLWFDANLPQNALFHEDSLDSAPESSLGKVEATSSKFKVEAFTMEPGWPQRLEARLNEIKANGYSHLEAHFVGGGLSAACIIYRPL